MARRSSLVFASALLALGLGTACDKGETAAPSASPGGRYFVYSGELPFYDSGCGQDRKPDGKLKKGMKFTLVSADGSCWLVTLEDEVDTYVLADGHVRAASK
ncbi:MAG: hypothetical protein R3B09_14065 [Nannocystaceae bacterium]